MKQTTKRKIAKEIVVIFSCAVLIGLTWTIFWLKNNYTIHQADKLQAQVEKITSDIDSIHLSFPKVIPFEKIIVGEIPVESLIEDNYIPMPDEVLGTEFDKTRISNIRKLYRLLSSFNFSFPPESFVSTLSNLYPDVKFTENIVKELESNKTDKLILRKIYLFLKEKNMLNMEFEEFTFNIEGLPLPPPHDTWTAYEKDKKQKEELNNQIMLTKSKIYSANDLTKIAQWISIIILTIVYPFRFLFLLLKWAVKTLNQKAT